MKIIAAVLVISVVVAMTALWLTHQNSNIELQIAGVNFTALIADEPHEWSMGLSGYDALPYDAAMLFVFPEPGRYGIWMKDMKFSIDIAWLDKEKRIVAIKENIGPDTFPEVFYPEIESGYVLEFPAGTVKRLRLDTGAQAIFSL